MGCSGSKEKEEKTSSEVTSAYRGEEENEPVRPTRRPSQLESSRGGGLQSNYRNTPAAGGGVSARSLSPQGPIRRSGVMANQSQHIVSNWEERFTGPGLRGQFYPDKVYACFEQKNGLLFRLVDQRQRIWAFYNDTDKYEMRVSVTFGHESSITALGSTKKAVINEETGSCQLDAVVMPGQVLPFMKGEYNGFKMVYEGIPV